MVNAEALWNAYIFEAPRVPWPAEAPSIDFASGPMKDRPGQRRAADSLIRLKEIDAMAKFCGACGQQLSDASAFCIHCGTPAQSASAASAAVPPPAPTPPAAPAQPAYAQVNPPAQPAYTPVNTPAAAQYAPVNAPSSAPGGAPPQYPPAP